MKDSTLDLLESDRIVRFFFEKDKTKLMAEECCDFNFVTSLDKKAVMLLITELIEIHGQMTDE